jgi:hypothetical protein
MNQHHALFQFTLRHHMLIFWFAYCIGMQLALACRMVFVSSHGVFARSVTGASRRKRSAFLNRSCSTKELRLDED